MTETAKKIKEDFYKEFIKGNRHFNIMSTGLELNPVVKDVGILVTIITDNKVLRDSAIKEIMRILPNVYKGMPVRVDGSAAIVSY